MSRVVSRTKLRVSGTLQDAAVVLTEAAKNPEIPGDALIVEAWADTTEERSLTSADDEIVSSALVLTLEWPA